MDAVFQIFISNGKDTVDQCLKPKNAVGNPSLVLFSDGSEEVYFSCVYARWEIDNGKYVS